MPQNSKKTKSRKPRKPSVRRITAKKRKQKGGKGHYKTGFHKSPKCSNGPAKYRSGWEKVVCEHLDSNPDVVEYQYEPFEIKYVSNQRTGRIRIYIPDFLIIYSNGKKKLVEVKREKHLERPTVKKKALIARAYAGRNNMEYEFWTDKKIRELQKMLKEKANEQKDRLKQNK